MDKPVTTGTWVEIHNVVLPVGERAPQVPGDTQQVPLEMRVKGCLVEPACLGEDADIVTPVGRHLRGTLVAVNPGHSHSFGPPVPELSAIGSEVRMILRARGRLK